MADVHFVHFPGSRRAVSYWGDPWEEPSTAATGTFDPIEDAPVTRWSTLSPGETLASYRHGLRHRTDDGLWLVAARIERNAERFDLVEVRIRPWPAAGNRPRVRAAALRAVQIGELSKQANRLLRINSSKHAELLDELEGNDLAQAVAAKEREFGGSGTVEPPAGRTPTKDELARRAALLWLELQAQGAKGLHERIAAELDQTEGFTTPGQVRYLLRRAEEIGLISKGERGRVQRTAGPALEEGKRGEIE